MTEGAAPRPAVDPERVRLVVFDLDGTLYDQARLRRRVVAALLGSLLRRPRATAAEARLLVHFRRCREELAGEEAAGIRRLQYERPARRLGVEPAAVEAAVAEWIHRRPLALLRGCRFAGVEGLIARLRAAGRRVAVLSDYAVDAKLAALGLEADLAVSAEDPEVDRLKPHPAGLERILELAGVAPEAVLMVGDREERDGACARLLGVPFALKVARRPAAAHEFRDFHALERRLLG